MGTEHIAPATEAAVGPADQPDDPLVNPVRPPVSAPVDTAHAVLPEAVTKPTAPTPDQEGCYYLG